VLAFHGKVKSRTGRQKPLTCLSLPGIPCCNFRQCQRWVSWTNWTRDGRAGELGITPIKVQQRNTPSGNNAVIRVALSRSIAYTFLLLNPGHGVRSRGTLRGTGGFHQHPVDGYDSGGQRTGPWWHTADMGAPYSCWWVCRVFPSRDWPRGRAEIAPHCFLKKSGKTDWIGWSRALSPLEECVLRSVGLLDWNISYFEVDETNRRSDGPLLLIFWYLKKPVVHLSRQVQE